MPDYLIFSMSLHRYVKPVLLVTKPGSRLGNMGRIYLNNYLALHEFCAILFQFPPLLTISLCVRCMIRWMELYRSLKPLGMNWYVVLIVCHLLVPYIRPHKVNFLFGGARVGFHWVIPDICNPYSASNHSVYTTCTHWPNHPNFYILAV